MGQSTVVDSLRCSPYSCELTAVAHFYACQQIVVHCSHGHAVVLEIFRLRPFSAHRVFGMLSVLSARSDAVPATGPAGMRCKTGKVLYSFRPFYGTDHLPRRCAEDISFSNAMRSSAPPP
ncbi:hypothetical protein DOTSEDRAFT_70197 [Dothistroma septosporum NZE10]|uniref:Uncharacterized protein n=1 Tax=Dothistroma septosporum (strain NZE10 / CBS 128990) TaxID=675120 RepID=N1PT52_DOTSN|nr:hypothetical protein DOTSEDRAFT_70197 [Dothistroma septosporum NZE10]